ncbi:hypothetical protein LJC20_05030 [Eubacteriales bacterium OttesenSCG-928-M02]|nr:hypothetical protein [Eubacteriales bacterium OttesenSCG-928-M02]
MDPTGHLSQQELIDQAQGNFINAYTSAGYTWDEAFEFLKAEVKRSGTDMVLTPKNVPKKDKGGRKQSGSEVKVSSNNNGGTLSPPSPISGTYQEVFEVGYDGIHRLEINYTYFATFAVNHDEEWGGFLVTANINREYSGVHMSFQYTFIIDRDGFIRFYFNRQTNYYDMMSEVLGVIMYRAAKAVDSQYLSRRTQKGIGAEIRGHYIWNSVFGNQNKVDMGGRDEDKPGYDGNAKWFERLRGFLL